MSEEEKAAVPRKKSLKPEILMDYYRIPDLLKKSGFLYLFNNLVIKKAEKQVRWKGPYGETNIEVFETYFTRTSQHIN